MRTDRVYIFDTTLRDGEQSPGAAMTPAARLRIMAMLAEAGVDVLEAGFPAASPLVAQSVCAIAAKAGGMGVAALARCNERDVDAAWESLRKAQAPRIHTFIATSDVHLRQKLRMTREQALEAAVVSVKRAKRYCRDVEFSAEDATRSDPVYLAQIFSRVIEVGATTINVPDTVGFMTPPEMERLVSFLFRHVDGIADVIVSVHTHDDLGMATANALAAVGAGARQVECTVNGIGERAGNCALEEVVLSLRTRQEVYRCDTAFRSTHIPALSRAVARATHMPVQKNKAIVGANAFAHQSGIHQDGMLKDRTTYEIINPAVIGIHSELPLGRNSGRHALMNRAERLGLRLDDAERKRFEEAFARFAERRRFVTDADLLRLARETRATVR